MSSTNLIDDDTIQHSIGPLERLRDQLGDLLLIHYEVCGINIPSVSTYLKELQYVCGEKSVAKSYMRFKVLIGPGGPVHDADEIFTVELSVKRRKECLVQS